MKGKEIQNELVNLLKLNMERLGRAFEMEKSVNMNITETRKLFDVHLLILDKLTNLRQLEREYRKNCPDNDF